MTGWLLAEGPRGAVPLLTVDGGALGSVPAWITPLPSSLSASPRLPQRLVNRAVFDQWKRLVWTVYKQHYWRMHHRPHHWRRSEAKSSWKYLYVFSPLCQISRQNKKQDAFFPPPVEVLRRMCVFVQLVPSVIMGEGGGVFKTLKWIHVKRRQPVRASQNPARGTSNRADESEQTAAVSGCLDRRLWC